MVPPPRPHLTSEGTHVPLLTSLVLSFLAERDTLGCCPLLRRVGSFPGLTALNPRTGPTQSVWFLSSPFLRCGIKAWSGEPLPGKAQGWSSWTRVYDILTPHPIPSHCVW